ncbi:hypoxanthine phosphoribosyltransferase 1 [Coelomomyces lativittatus]|nr:hypoxanthine phosphoribosyltransferase 1 [Coelomomyces lativittatus]
MVIPDDYQGYPLNHFVIPPHYEHFLDSIMIPHGVILDRIQKLALDIHKNIKGPILAVCILKGGFQFFSDLVAQLKKLLVPMQIDFIRVKSYMNTDSTGTVNISYTESELEGLRGKHLLLVEDIVDTGKTMVALLNKLQPYQPASLNVVSLLLKRTTRSNDYVPDYVGFEVPDKFILGYALDYNEHFRDLDHICTMNEAGIEAYKV